MQNLNLAKQIVKDNKGKMFSLYALLFLVTVAGGMLFYVLPPVVDFVVLILLVLYITAMKSVGIGQLPLAKPIDWGDVIGDSFSKTVENFGSIIVAYLFNILLMVPAVLALWLLFLWIVVYLPLSVNTISLVNYSNGYGDVAMMSALPAVWIFLIAVLVFAFVVYTEFLQYLFLYKTMAATDNKQVELSSHYTDMWKMAAIGALWCLIPFVGIVFYFIWYAFYMTKVKLDVAQMPDNPYLKSVYEPKHKITEEHKQEEKEAVDESKEDEKEDAEEVVENLETKDEKEEEKEIEDNKEEEKKEDTEPAEKEE